jgi:hypothetical protein
VEIEDISADSLEDALVKIKFGVREARVESGEADW